MKDTKRRTKLQAKDDDLRRRWIAIYDNAPPELRPVLVAGIEFVAARYTGKQPRPGASEENLMTLLGALEKARREGNAPMIRLIERWLSRDALQGEY